MANGVEQDIRDLRRDVKVIAEKGCAHKEAHDKSITEIWTAFGEERKERQGTFIKTIIMVLVIVAGAMVANIFATSTVVEQTITKVMAIQATRM